MSSLSTGTPNMSYLPSILRLTRTRGGLFTPRRGLAYPRQPLTEALPNLAASGNQLVEDRLYSEQTRITRLENGLRVASQDAFGQFSTVGVWVDAGSRHEIDYTSGITHLLQRLAFQSTSRFQSREHLMSELEKYGGSFDCQRFRDVSMYVLSAFSFALPEAVEVLAEAFWRPGLSKEELETERQTVQFELEDLHNGPNSEPLLLEMIHQAAYRDNTLGLPGLCPPENLEKIKVEDLKLFLASHYTPERLVLTGVNVDHTKLVDLARTHFVDPRTSWEGIKTKPVDDSISQYTSGKMEIARSGPPIVGPNPLPELTHVVLALESSSYLDEDFFAYAVLNSLMGGGGSFSAGGPGKGMYTQIYVNVLTQNHWVYSAISQNHAYSDTGIFCLFGSADPTKARDLTEVLCRQFHEMTKEPKQADLARAKEQLKSIMMMNLESRLVVFEDIGRQVIGYDKRLSSKDLCAKIDAVTSKDLERVGKRLMESNPSIAALGDLTHVPSKREVEEALNSKGFLPKNRKLFSFS